MPFVVANHGVDKLLDRLSIGGKVRLYQNNKTPAAGDGPGDYTEATFSGYSDQTANKGTSSATGGKATNVLTPPSTFEHDGGGTGNDVYGFYVTDTDGNVLHYAERFPNAPVTMQDDGDTITVTVTFTMEQV